MPQKIKRGYISYRYTCEACGKTTDWCEKEASVETGRPGGPFRRRAAEPRNGRGEELERREDAMLLGVFALIKRRADSGDYSDFEKGACCPFCGQRQSWYNAQPTGTVVFSVIITLATAFVCGIFLGIVLNMLGISGMSIPIGACLLVGAVLVTLIVLVPHFSDRRLAKAAGTREIRQMPEINWDVYKKKEPPE